MLRAYGFVRSYLFLCLSVGSGCAGVLVTGCSAAWSPAYTTRPAACSDLSGMQHAAQYKCLTLVNVQVGERKHLL